MPKVTLNPLIKEMRGKMGDVVFRTLPNGEIIVSKSPDMSGVKWSQAQTKHRQRFKEASAYAQAVMADPKVRAKYEKRAAKEKRIPYRVAL
jgi:hypothetical protein